MIPQAYPPVLLERKAMAIRQAMDEEKASGVPIRISMETTDRQCVDHIFILSRAYDSGSWGAVVSKGLIRPFRMFMYEPIIQLLGLYMAYVYGLLYSTRLGSSQFYAV
jgi:transcriptional regulator of heat shock response